MKTQYRPPFEITTGIVTRISEIMRLVGRYEGLFLPAPQPQLWRHNRARSIQGSLALEGNTLSTEQVTAMLENRHVAGSPREILEARNAIAAYEQAKKFRPTGERDLLRAHGLLMKGLISDAGRFRTGNVGILHGSRVAHVAPPARQVPRLVKQLLGFLRSDRSLHPLVTSAVAHYEIEFIHPFSDGNGRLGRLWQHVLLLRLHPVFEFVPIESIEQARQKDYYRALGESDQAGHPTSFVELSLETIERALADLLGDLRPRPSDAVSRLEGAREVFGAREFSRRDYMRHFKTLSPATASRDVRAGVDAGLLVKMGEKARTKYRFG